MKPHRTDGLSLTFGLIFLGIVVVWLFNQAVNVHLNAGWIVAIGLIVFGLLGLLGALRSDKSDKPSSSVPASSVPSSHDPDDVD
ncbi:hypothetical protein Daura_47685 [Dactylosporangium aurantiacum]|uniref:Uncharacterized protein n=1 Tax=Dactylosporangium aurantiacum TaxID=35754 RepID=A0A9Q9IH58_9ACTN|nr:hypothetical protein [Dactylosporangium aurantiacum]MDG6105375.1 hypothetical protein [Dactylosporangium aurantiacum]UWZ54080.1 hypothetical protein Daura_47685 [Dactylosporangium aurantiacum]